MGWGRTRWLAAIAAACALLPTAAHAATAAPRPLHATPTGIADDRGRQVLLRGVNINGLGDYYRAVPSLDPVVALGRGDVRDIAALGMDVVRLIVHWSALEPRRGAFDEAYVARIRQAVRWARASGVHVVLDMHQDAWGKAIATPPGASCPPGLSPSVGWDGAPAWATLTGGLTTCHAAERELSPAVAMAWQSFYANRQGTQDELVTTWARLARAFAADPTVAGYDLLNEPNPGLLPLANGATALGRFYARTLTAIRAAERDVAGGFAHIAFFEPGVEWSAASLGGTPLPGFTRDRDIVFSPHLYAGSITLDRALGVELLSVDEGFAAAAAVAGLYGSTVWSGEWGWFGAPAADAAHVARYAAQEDAHRWGGAWWDWRQACGDPHNIAAPGAQPGSVSPSLHRYACPAQIDLGIPEATRRILARAYPRAVPGRLTALASDPATGTLTAAGTAPAAGGSCLLDVWYPGADRPAATGTGLGPVTARRVDGGWRLAACASGPWALRATR